MLLQNNGDHSTTDIKSHPKGHESSATLLWDPNFILFLSLTQQIFNVPQSSCTIHTHIHIYSTAQFLMWHTIAFLITVIIYLLLQPTTPYWSRALAVHAPSTLPHYKNLHKHCISRVQNKLYELASTVFKLTFSVHSVFPYFSYVTHFPLTTTNLCYLSFYSPQSEDSSKLERFQLNQYFIHD
jgi:hypothetical protein